MQHRSAAIQLAVRAGADLGVVCVDLIYSETNARVFCFASPMELQSADRRQNSSTRTPVVCFRAGVKNTPSIGIGARRLIANHALIHLICDENLSLVSFDGAKRQAHAMDYGYKNKSVSG